jgi:hypothetical protein
MKILRMLTLPFALVLAIVIGYGPAFADTNGPLATTGGSSAQWFHSGDYFRICDTRSDGDAVYVKFSYSGSGGDIILRWSGGSGTCTNRTYNITEGRTVTYRSCVDDFPPDTCSSPKTGVA